MFNSHTVALSSWREICVKKCTEGPMRKKTLLNELRHIWTKKSKLYLCNPGNLIVSKDWWNVAMN